MRQLLLLCILSIGYLRSFSQTQKTAAIQQIVKDFEQQLKKDVLQDDVGSISAAIFIDHEIIWSGAFGWADKSKHILADTNTIYRTGSVTKTFTAYLMMLMNQEGTIKIDDPVVNYFPEAGHLKRSVQTPVTFRQLASHTAGLAEEPTLKDAASGPFINWEKKVIEAIPTIPVIAAPDSVFEYSNIGYGILGVALSRAGHQSYTSLVDEKILRKLKMDNSFFQIPSGKEDRVAAGYSINPVSGTIDAAKPKREHAGRGYKVPNGGLYATADDLCRFLIAQCHSGEKNSLLTKESSDMMTNIQTPESNNGSYGFGYYIRNDHGLKIVEHDGGVAGYNAFIAWNPDFKVGIVLLRNYNVGLTDLMQRPRVTLYEICKLFL
jgi:CubicO group peptidase (beta-lactamase class C family)